MKITQASSLAENKSTTRETKEHPLTIDEINARDPRPKRPVDYSRTEETYVLKYEDINGQGALFGGRLLGWIDELGGYAARRHASNKVVTCAIDNLCFKRGVGRNQMVFMESKVTYVGKTSLEVRVDTYAESIEGIRTPINRAYLVYVAVADDNVTPVPVKYGLEVRTEAEHAEYLGALKRRQARALRRKEGF